VAWASYLLHVDQANCNKQRGLIEFIFWTQTSETAHDDLERYDSITSLAFQTPALTREPFCSLT
jgi:hypothetical protein